MAICAHYLHMDPVRIVTPNNCHQPSFLSASCLAPGFLQRALLPHGDPAAVVQRDHLSSHAALSAGIGGHCAAKGKPCPAGSNWSRQGCWWVRFRLQPDTTHPPAQPNPHLFLRCRRIAAGALKRKLSNKSSSDDQSKQQQELDDEPDEQQAAGAKRASTPDPKETVRPARTPPPPDASAAAQLPTDCLLLCGPRGAQPTPCWLWTQSMLSCSCVIPTINPSLRLLVAGELLESRLTAFPCVFPLGPLHPPCPGAPCRAGVG